MVPSEAEGLEPVAVVALHETRIDRPPAHARLFVEPTIMALGDAPLVMSVEDTADVVDPSRVHTLSAPADPVAGHTLVPGHERVLLHILRIHDTAEVEAVRVHSAGQGGVIAAMILGIAGQGHQEISVAIYYEAM